MCFVAVWQIRTECPARTKGKITAFHASFLAPLLGGLDRGLAPSRSRDGPLTCQRLGAWGVCVPRFQGSQAALPLINTAFARPEYYFDVVAFWRRLRAVACAPRPKQLLAWERGNERATCFSYLLKNMHYEQWTENIFCREYLDLLL